MEGFERDQQIRVNYLIGKMVTGDKDIVLIYPWNKGFSIAIGAIQTLYF